MKKQDVEKLINKLVIIPDTNILLYLYKCSFSTSKNIVVLLNKVKEKINIPFRVYEEYEDHKFEEQAKIDSKYDKFTKNMKKQVTDLQKSISNSIAETRKYDFPDCDDLQSKLDSAFHETVDIIDQYNNSLSSEKDNKEMQIEAVERLVQELKNKGKVREKPNLLKILDYIREGEFRYRYKMPPGFMDEEEKDKSVNKDKKNDNFVGRTRKFGDLFIWKDILEIGSELSEQEYYLLFLTNDVKEDWWNVKGEEKNLIPISMRDELHDEYLGYVGNDRIEFMRLTEFYCLFSEFYEIQDIKTQLELDYDSYVQNVMTEKHNETVEKNICDSIDGIEWDNIFEEPNLIKPNVEFCDYTINNINIHYDLEDEYAIYDVQVFILAYPIEIFRNNKKEKELVGTIELESKFMFQIRRDLRHLDDDEIELKHFSYEIRNHKEPWKVEEELLSNTKADMADILENGFTH